MSTLLSIKHLSVNVGETKILDRVSLDITQGSIVGLVGGSGSGKTTLGFSIIRLLPHAMQVNSGAIVFDGQDVMNNNDQQMRALRGKDIGVVFQDPLSAFDPLFTIGYQMDETLAAHTDLNPKARKERTMHVLSQVEINDSLRIYRSYPHELSGGLRQRAMIAQAIVCNPKLVIADEPTSSLDVTIQAKIMQLLRKINKEQGTTILLIAHDLSLIARLADQAAVMTEGKIVEFGTTAEILKNPQHVYTKALIEAY